MNKNLPKSVTILILEQMALAAKFYFGQVLKVFPKVNKKNVLQWFLPIICNEHTLRRSTTLFSRNHPKLCFWLRKWCQQTPSTEPLLHQTDKNSHRRCYIKWLFFKISQYSQEKTCVGVSLKKIASLQACNFIRKRLRHRCFPVA